MGSLFERTATGQQTAAALKTPRLQMCSCKCVGQIIFSRGQPSVRFATKNKGLVTAAEAVRGGFLTQSQANFIRDEINSSDLPMRMADDMDRSTALHAIIHAHGEPEQVDSCSKIVRAA